LILIFSLLSADSLEELEEWINDPDNRIKEIPEKLTYCSFNAGAPSNNENTKSSSSSQKSKCDANEKASSKQRLSCRIQYIRL